MIIKNKLKTSLKTIETISGDFGKNIAKKNLISDNGVITQRIVHKNNNGQEQEIYLEMIIELLYQLRNLSRGNNISILQTKIKNELINKIKNIIVVNNNVFNHFEVNSALNNLVLEKNMQNSNIIDDTIEIIQKELKKKETKFYINKFLQKKEFQTDIEGVTNKRKNIFEHEIIKNNWNKFQKIILMYYQNYCSVNKFFKKKNVYLQKIDKLDKKIDVNKIYYQNNYNTDIKSYFSNYYMLGGFNKDRIISSYKNFSSKLDISYFWNIGYSKNNFKHFKNKGRTNATNLLYFTKNDKNTLVHFLKNKKKYISKSNYKNKKINLLSKEIKNYFVLYNKFINEKEIYFDRQKNLIKTDILLNKYILDDIYKSKKINNYENINNFLSNYNNFIFKKLAKYLNYFYNSHMRLKNDINNNIIKLFDLTYLKENIVSPLSHFLRNELRFINENNYKNEKMTFLTNKIENKEATYFNKQHGKNKNINLLKYTLENIYKTTSYNNYKNNIIEYNNKEKLYFNNLTILSKNKYINDNSNKLVYFTKTNIDFLSYFLKNKLKSTNKNDYKNEKITFLTNKIESKEIIYSDKRQNKNISLSKYTLENIYKIVSYNNYKNNIIEYNDKEKKYLNYFSNLMILSTDKYINDSDSFYFAHNILNKLYNFVENELKFIKQNEYRNKKTIFIKEIRDNLYNNFKIKVDNKKVIHLNKLQKYFDKQQNKDISLSKYTLENIYKIASYNNYKNNIIEYNDKGKEYLNYFSNLMILSTDQTDKYINNNKSFYFVHNILNKLHNFLENELKFIKQNEYRNKKTIFIKEIRDNLYNNFKIKVDNKKVIHLNKLQKYFDKQQNKDISLSKYTLENIYKIVSYNNYKNNIIGYNDKKKEYLNYFSNLMILSTDQTDKYINNNKSFYFVHNILNKLHNFLENELKFIKQNEYRNKKIIFIKEIRDNLYNTFKVKVDNKKVIHLNKLQNVIKDNNLLYNFENNYKNSDIVNGYKTKKYFDYLNKTEVLFKNKYINDDVSKYIYFTKNIRANLSYFLKNEWKYIDKNYYETKDFLLKKIKNYFILYNSLANKFNNKKIRYFYKEKNDIGDNILLEYNLKNVYKNKEFNNYKSENLFDYTNKIIEYFDYYNDLMLILQNKNIDSHSEKSIYFINNIIEKVLYFLKNKWKFNKNIYEKEEENILLLSETKSNLYDNLIKKFNNEKITYFDEQQNVFKENNLLNSYIRKNIYKVEKINNNSKGSNNNAWTNANSIFKKLKFENISNIKNNYSNFKIKNNYQNDKFSIIYPLNKNNILINSFNHLKIKNQIGQIIRQEIIFLEKSLKGFEKETKSIYINHKNVLPSIFNSNNKESISNDTKTNIINRENYNSNNVLDVVQKYNKNIFNNFLNNQDTINKNIEKFIYTTHINHNINKDEVEKQKKDISLNSKKSFTDFNSYSLEFINAIYNKEYLFSDIKNNSNNFIKTNENKHSYKYINMPKLNYYDNTVSTNYDQSITLSYKEDNKEKFLIFEENNRIFKTETQKSFFEVNELKKIVKDIVYKETDKIIEDKISRINKTQEYDYNGKINKIENKIADVEENIVNKINSNKDFDLNSVYERVYSMLERTLMSERRRVGK